MTQRLDAKGSSIGKKWDDGSDHDDVTKIYVRGGNKAIQYIYFDYVKNGKPKDGSIHGGSGKGFTQTVRLGKLVTSLYSNSCRQYRVFYDLLFLTNFCSLRLTIKEMNILNLLRFTTIKSSIIFKPFNSKLISGHLKLWDMTMELSIH